jgi:hypothetical protein
LSRRAVGLASEFAILSPLPGPRLAVRRVRLGRRVATTQTATEFVEDFVVLHPEAARRGLVPHRFGGAHREQIVRERGSDVIHTADREAVKV